MRTAPTDALTRRALFLHTLLAVLTDTGTGSATGAGPTGNSHNNGGGLPAMERSVLDTAITATYTAAGITDDRTTWALPAPLLTDLRATLRRIANPDTPAAASDDAAPRGGPRLSSVGELEAAAPTRHTAAPVRRRLGDVWRPVRGRW